MVWIYRDQHAHKNIHTHSFKIYIIEFRCIDIIDSQYSAATELNIINSFVRFTQAQMRSRCTLRRLSRITPKLDTDCMVFAAA